MNHMSKLPSVIGGMWDSDFHCCKRGILPAGSRVRWPEQCGYSCQSSQVDHIWRGKGLVLLFCCKPLIYSQTETKMSGVWANRMRNRTAFYICKSYVIFLHVYLLTN